MVPFGRAGRPPRRGLHTHFAETRGRTSSRWPFAAARWSTSNAPAGARSHCVAHSVMPEAREVCPPRCRRISASHCPIATHLSSASPRMSYMRCCIGARRRCVDVSSSRRFRFAVARSSSGDAARHAAQRRQQRARPMAVEDGHWGARACAGCPRRVGRSARSRWCSRRRCDLSLPRCSSPGRSPVRSRPGCGAVQFVARTPIRRRCA